MGSDGVPPEESGVRVVSVTRTVTFYVRKVSVSPRRGGTILEGERVGEVTNLRAEVSFLFLLSETKEVVSFKLME